MITIKRQFGPLPGIEGQGNRTQQSRTCADLLGANWGRSNESRVHEMADAENKARVQHGSNGAGDEICVGLRIGGGLWRSKAADSEANGAIDGVPIALGVGLPLNAVGAVAHVVETDGHAGSRTRPRDARVVQIDPVSVLIQDAQPGAFFEDRFREIDPDFAGRGFEARTAGWFTLKRLRMGCGAWNQQEGEPEQPLHRRRASAMASRPTNRMANGAEASSLSGSVSCWVWVVVVVGVSPAGRIW